MGVPFHAFEAAPLTHNARGLLAHYTRQFCVEAIWGDSYQQVSASNASQIHFFLPAHMQFWAGKGVQNLGYSLGNCGSFDAYATNGFRTLAGTTGRPPVFETELVPGGIDSGNTWVTTDQTQPWADGYIPVRIQQRGYSDGNFGDATAMQIVRCDDTLLGDYLKQDDDLAIHVTFYGSTTASDISPLTIQPAKSTGTGNSSAEGATTALDPTVGNGIQGVSAPYNANPSEAFNGAGEGPALLITGTAGDETGLVTHLVDFTWHNVTAQPGKIIYCAEAQGDGGVVDWASTSSSAPTGSAVPPRKFFNLTQGLIDYYNAKPFAPTVITLWGSENDDRDPTGSTWTNESAAAYVAHYSEGGGYRACRRAQIQKALAVLDAVNPNGRVVVITTPPNKRASGSFSGPSAPTTTGVARYTAQAWLDYLAVLDVADDRVSYLNLLRWAGTRLFTDAADDSDLLDSDEVHPTLAGQLYLLGGVYDLLQIGEGEGPRGRPQRVRGWGVR